MKGFLVFEETWEYKWMGEEPAPKFPTFYFLYVYVVRKGIKEFPKRFYSVFKRFLTNSWKPKQVPSSNVGNQIGSSPAGTPHFSNHTL
jgi:hypothetical protein